jgi:transposase
VPAQAIDKGLPTAGLLAQMLVGKYADHQPLYRQEAIFERAGLALPRSSLAQWVGECGVLLAPLIDALKAALLTEACCTPETPVAMLKPGHGKTHRAYLWSYCTSAFDCLQAVV